MTPVLAHPSDAQGWPETKPQTAITPNAFALRVQAALEGCAFNDLCAAYAAMRAPIDRINPAEAAAAQDAAKQFHELLPDASKAWGDVLALMQRALFEHGYGATARDIQLLATIVEKG